MIRGIGQEKSRRVQFQPSFCGIVLMSTSQIALPYYESVIISVAFCCEHHVFVLETERALHIHCTSIFPTLDAESRCHNHLLRSSLVVGRWWGHDEPATALVVPPGYVRPDLRIDQPLQGRPAYGNLRRQQVSLALAPVHGHSRGVS